MSPIVSHSPMPASRLTSRTIMLLIVFLLLIPSSLMPCTI